MNVYSKERNESKQDCSSNKLICEVLDAKHEKVDLNKVNISYCQC